MTVYQLALSAVVMLSTAVLLALFTAARQFWLETRHGLRCRAPQCPHFGGEDFWQNHCPASHAERRAEFRSLYGWPRTRPAWWVFARGLWWLRRGYCPCCYSSPPRQSCPVCHGADRPGAHRSAIEVRADWRGRWKALA